MSLRNAGLDSSVLGLVKFYHAEKEYGFIVGDDDVERFFNSNQVRTPDLKPGDRVKFLPLRNDRGPIAYQVERLP